VSLFYKIPDEIMQLPPMKADQVTELSAHAKSFLLNLAHTAHSESERLLQAASDSSSDVGETFSWDALKLILSVLAPGTVHPWIEPPTFKVPGVCILFNFLFVHVLVFVFDRFLFIIIVVLCVYVCVWYEMFCFSDELACG
jgi:hypothetical protein